MEIGFQNQQYDLPWTEKYSEEDHLKLLKCIRENLTSIYNLRLNDATKKRLKKFLESYLVLQGNYSAK